MTDKDNLKIAVQEFANEMLDKLLEKADEWWHGWNDPKNIPAIRESLITHIGRFLSGDNKEYVDISSLCMMLHKMIVKGEYE